MRFCRSVFVALSLMMMVVLHALGQTPNAAREEARRRAEVAVEALQRWYVPRTGLYRTTGWWNSANAITAIADYMRLAGEKKYVSVLENTFAKAQIAVPIA